MVTRLILFLLCISCSISAQGVIICHFQNGAKVRITKEYFNVNFEPSVPIESLRINGDDENDITNFEFVTKNFHYWFCRSDGKLIMVISPKNPIWINFSDPRNQKFIIKSYSISGKWN